MKLLADVRLKSGPQGLPPPVAGANLATGKTSVFEDIRIRSETITPVLREILDLHPANRMDVNQENGGQL